MKIRNIKEFTWACVLGCTVTFLPACSDDNETPVVPEFPDNKEALSFQTAGEQELTFTANTNWTLSSSKLWCKFKSGEENVQSLIGIAGKQTVTVVVDETLWGLEDATAELKLTMSGQTQTIATVTRGAQSMSIEGLEKVTVVYNSTDLTTALTVKANFDWELKAESLPKWMEGGELPRKGYAGRTYNIPVSVKKEYVPFAQTEGNMIFFRSETEETISIPAEYTGMPEDAIEISAPERAYGWSVSADGTVYSQGSLAGEDTEKLAFPMDIQVMTKNNEYVVVRFVGSSNGLVTPDPWSGNDFFSVEDNGNGQLVMNAPSANTGAAREAFVLIVPKEVYESLGGSPDNMLDQTTWDDIKPEYQRYVVFSFTQEAGNTASGGFKIKLQGWQDVECLPADDTISEYAMMVSGATGISMENIYYTKVSSNFYQVAPQLTTEQWNPMRDGTNGITIMAFDGTDYKENWSLSMSMDGEYAMEGMVEKDMFISFSDMSQGWPMPAKALIFIVEE